MFRIVIVIKNTASRKCYRNLVTIEVCERSHYRVSEAELRWHGISTPEGRAARTPVSEKLLAWGLITTAALQLYHLNTG